MNPIEKQNVVLFIEHTIIDITQVTKLNNTLKQMQHSSNQRLVSKRAPVYDHTPKNKWNCDINRKRGIRFTKKLLWQIESNQRSFKNKYLNFNQNFKIQNKKWHITYEVLDFGFFGLEITSTRWPLTYMVFDFYGFFVGREFSFFQ